MQTTIAVDFIFRLSLSHTLSLSLSVCRTVVPSLVLLCTLSCGSAVGSGRVVHGTADVVLGVSALRMGVHGLTS